VITQPFLAAFYPAPTRLTSAFARKGAATWDEGAIMMYKRNIHFQEMRGSYFMLGTMPSFFGGINEGCVGMMKQRLKDVDTFYSLLAELEARTGQRSLGECDNHIAWPLQGVYFFFEPGE